MNMNYKSKPKWIPLSELTFFGRKLFMKDENTGFASAGTPKEDGTFDWPYSYLGSKPTHYWSF